MSDAPLRGERVFVIHPTPGWIDQGVVEGPAETMHFVKVRVQRGPSGRGRTFALVTVPIAWLAPITNQTAVAVSSIRQKAEEATALWRDAYAQAEQIARLK